MKRIALTFLIIWKIYIKNRIEVYFYNTNECAK